MHSCNPKVQYVKRWAEVHHVSIYHIAFSLATLQDIFYTHPSEPQQFLSYSQRYPEAKRFNMSDMQATVAETKNGFHVDGFERISYDFTFLDGVFNLGNTQLADCYHRWGRVLAVTDQNVYNVYGEQIERYFEHHGLELKVHKTKIGEKAKTIPTFLSIVDSMTEFGIYRKVRPSLGNDTSH